MSLMRVRRERRAVGSGLKRGMPVWRLVALLILVLALIWWLGGL
ncbi:MAG TPA: hypothetical protein VF167_08595 [Longimicrobiaceae bacterium]